MAKFKRVIIVTPHSDTQNDLALLGHQKCNIQYTVYMAPHWNIQNM